MQTALITTQGGQVLPSHLVELAFDANEKYRNAKAKATRVAYASDWRHFEGWCQENGLTALPAQTGTLALYVTACAKKHKLSTIRRRLTGIAQKHKEHDLETPTANRRIHTLIASIAREKHERPNKKEAMHLANLKQVLKHVNTDTLIGKRDACILRVGFWACLRRSELANLNVSDVQFTDEGVTINIRFSKTDQEGAGQKVGLCYRPNIEVCPVRALQRWLEASGLQSGALFRHVIGDAISAYILKRGGVELSRHERVSGGVIAHCIKRYCRMAGLDAANFSGHSLRRGFATTADRSRVSFTDIKRHGRWRHDATCRSYMETTDIWENNPTAAISE